ncbi:hypothetical protein [Streptomyces goshikiensis]|uniref:hypothetical protein n=1 Tax=Streptomyces goshikiensis TaxID=1942 RepID=UPI0036CAA565
MSSYIRRKPGPRKAKGLSVWAIAGLCAVVWLWGQVFEFSDSSAQQQPSPKPAVSASAGGQ